MDIINLNIFIPDTNKVNSCGRYRGYALPLSDALLGIYICDKYSTLDEDFSESDIFSVCLEIAENSIASQPTTQSDDYYICLSAKPEAISIAGFSSRSDNLLDKVANATIIFYNYKSFLLSEDRCLENSDESVNKNRFAILKKIINLHEKSNTALPENNLHNGKNTFNDDNNTFFKKSHPTVNFLRSYSHLFVQLTDFCRFLYWITVSLFKDKKISVKTGNLILAIIVDLICGIAVYYAVDQCCHMPLDEIFIGIEWIVHNLQTLIKWLMGSPAGLKLNHAFNTMLGKFFIYHIDLWWMFLVTSKDVLEMFFEVFKILGWLGITFQAAILADLLSLASFHALCIYTYAARLYNIQISALIALWRLFLGKKHNPLRGGVDSCEYNHHQLFVGTIVFTILVFLLPTTALYYVVFTAFRIMFVLLGGILSKLTYTLQALPAYLFILWILRSPKIAGAVEISLIEEISFSCNKINCVCVHLNTSSFFHLMKIYKPTPVSEPESIEWKTLLSNLCKGKLIYSV